MSIWKWSRIHVLRKSDQEECQILGSIEMILPRMSDYKLPVFLILISSKWNKYEIIKTCRNSKFLKTWPFLTLGPNLKLQNTHTYTHTHTIWMTVPSSLPILQRSCAILESQERSSFILYNGCFRTLELNHLWEPLWRKDSSFFILNSASLSSSSNV